MDVPIGFTSTAHMVHILVLTDHKTWHASPSCLHHTTSWATKAIEAPQLFLACSVGQWARLRTTALGIMPTHGTQVNNIDSWPSQWWEFMDRANLNHQPPPGWLNGWIPLKFIYCLIYIYIYSIKLPFPSRIIVIYCFYYLWVGNNQESKLVNHPWVECWLNPVLNPWGFYPTCGNSYKTLWNAE